MSRPSPVVDRATKPSRIPAYALFDTPASTPSPPKEQAPTPPKDESKFWVCMVLPSGSMVKVRCYASQTTGDLRQSAVEQLEEFISHLKHSESITLQGASGAVSLKEEQRVMENEDVHNVLKKQQVPMLALAPVSVPVRSETAPTPKLPPRDSRLTSSSPGLMGEGPFGLSPGTSSPLLTRRNKFTDMMKQIPLSFDELADQKEKEKTQRVLIESLLVDSYSKMRLHNEEDEESALFKSTIFPAVRQIQPRTKLSLCYSPVTHHPWPESLNETFPVTFNFPAVNLAKTLDIQPSMLVGDLLVVLLSKSHLERIRSKDPATVTLKFCDYTEYLHSAMKMGMIVRVRDFLKRRKQLNFSVVDNEDLVALHGEAVRHDAEYVPRTDRDLFADYSPPRPAANSSPVFECDYNFQIRILPVKNLRSFFPVYFEDAAEQNSNSFAVSVELFHGATSLAAPKWTELPGHTDFDDWLGIPGLKISQIPRATKACITLYVKNYKEMVPMGWVNFQLFDYESVLRSGEFTLPLWLNGKANPIGTCALNLELSKGASKPLTITIELPSYADHPVMYPSFSHLLHPAQGQERRAEDPTMVLNSRIEQLIHQEPLYNLSQNEKKMLWENRRLLMCVPLALPKVLRSVDWTNSEMVEEALTLMGRWAALPGSAALQLLDAHYPAPEVREYAINCMRTVPDVDLADYFLQLVQVVKYEPYHDSALSRFLLQRALQNRERLGHIFFWYLKSELAVPDISQRYTLLMEAYLYGCGDHLFELAHQSQLVFRLQKIAEGLKTKKRNKKEFLQKELREFNVTQRVHLPIVPTMTINGFNVNKCKYMDSFTMPLWLECKNNDPFGNDIKMIFKVGDDLRADILTLQMFRLMDKLWKNAGLDMNLSPYMCTSTGAEVGMIEVVPNSVTAASIQKERGVVTGVIKKTPLAKWLREKNPTDFLYNQAVENFYSSLAGYCVATYVLGIGDRHNDNIMIAESGHLFHIDFAHFLGNVQTWQGIKRERAPFVLTPEFVYVMGKTKSPVFKKFINLCCKAFNVLRKHANLFINLFSMMLSTGIPELKCDEDINYLRNAFALNKTDKEAAKFFISLIDESMNTKATQVNFLIHNLAHPT